MNVLLLGESGYLGGYLRTVLNADLPKGRGPINWPNSPYDYVINCIGRASLEACEANPADSEEANLNIVREITRRYNSAKIIHFSSYYVYDDEGLCTEESKTTDRYVYTRHKLESERLIAGAGGLTLRIGKLFGKSPNSSQQKLTEHILNNSHLTLDRMRFNPTSLTQVHAVVAHELKCNDLSGIYNLSNAGSCTHLEYGEFINALCGGNKTIEAVDRIPRMFHNYGRFAMSTKRIEAAVPLRHWKVDLQEYVNSLI